jgi:hypothetical protein
MGTYQTIATSQKTSTKAILAFILTTDLSAKNAKLAIETVTKTVMPQQFIQGALTKDKPFKELCLSKYQQLTTNRIKAHTEVLFCRSLFCFGGRNGTKFSGKVSGSQLSSPRSGGGGSETASSERSSLAEGCRGSVW